MESPDFLPVKADMNFPNAKGPKPLSLLFCAYGSSCSAWLQRWHAALLLLQCQALAALDELDEACLVCEEAMQQSSTAGCQLQHNGHTPQV